VRGHEPLFHKRPPDQQVSNGGRAGGGGHKTPTVRSENCFLSRTDRGRLSSAHVAVTAAFASRGPDRPDRPKISSRTTFMSVLVFVSTVGSMK
jgi:hypothetical protein